MGTTDSTGATRPEPSSGPTTIIASIAAVGSVVAALSCCLPVFPFLVAAGLAGSSTFLSEVRPYLLMGSIVFIAFGFYKARRAKACHHPRSIIASVLLWVSAGFVLISILFPQVVANAIAGLGTR
jgi:hypothetical protein